ncbi:MAG: Hypothetical protein C75L2_00030088 [Leptospirillum sp. Group II 'C75']|jgi:hypothetical protein|uniref:Uncharacterized protein n=1 Tax=Leptospirillum sp. Group II '5-way CG' TaxID=419541 RepID=B6AM18_9BACT|nr:hypothetical protein [Leptospirillum sp. Group II 'CF-1']AKS22740.1 hypothetical protein ABH19_01695 [Leptospirillum sp. Group II 'CF-1']EDZ39525.1 MAG: Hypothetical protein CGL2_11277164 [Leptospirillum sp. Group II '5-way CG']EIJ77090.1 MAG: Hypothetical protein C75L2_00030088 [Leptospirillum sp. Group II 'C75']
MNNIQGFDQQNNDAGTAGILAGIVIGIGSYLGLETLWWKAGFGPWNWSTSDLKSATIHAYFLCLIHRFFPNHVSDLNGGQTWFEFRNWLISNHLNDAFFASFWIPLTVGILAGILTAWFVTRAINRQGKNYRRGSRIV